MPLVEFASGSRWASSDLVVHGADLSCAELCRSSVFSVLSHPSPDDLPSLCPPPLLSPVLAHWVIVLWSLPFLSPLSTIGTISHTTHALAKHLLLFFFFFPCFLAVQFPLIAPSFIPLFVWFWAHFVHSPTLFLSFSLSPPSPNLAFTCVCLLISKCFLPSHLFSPGVANQSRFCLY